MEKLEKSFKLNKEEYSIEEITSIEQNKKNDKIIELTKNIKSNIKISSTPRSYKMKYGNDKDVGESSLLYGENFKRNFLVSHNGEVVGSINYYEKNGKVSFPENDRNNLNNPEVVKATLEELKYDPDIINNNPNMLFKMGAYYFNVEYMDLMVNIISFKKRLMNEKPDGEDKENLKKAISFHEQEAMKLAKKIRKYHQKIVDLDPKNETAQHNLKYIIENTNDSFK